MTFAAFKQPKEEAKMVVTGWGIMRGVSKVLEEVLNANQSYASTFGEKGKLATPPVRGFGILTCMDARLDPARFAGLAEGDAHVIRNAGGRASEDAIRSLVISCAVLNTTEWFVIHHTDCGMLTFTNESMRELLSKKLGALSTEAEYVEWLTFRDLAQSVTADVTRIRAHPLVPGNVSLYGYIYDVSSGGLIEVPEANKAGEPRAQARVAHA